MLQLESLRQERSTIDPAADTSRSGQDISHQPRPHRGRPSKKHHQHQHQHRHHAHFALRRPTSRPSGTHFQHLTRVAVTMLTITTYFLHTPKQTGQTNAATPPHPTLPPQRTLISSIHATYRGQLDVAEPRAGQGLTTYTSLSGSSPHMASASTRGWNCT